MKHQGHEVKVPVIYQDHQSTTTLVTEAIFTIFIELYLFNVMRSSYANPSF